MKRGRRKLCLVLDDVTRAEVTQRIEQTTDVRERERLQAVRLAASGHYTYAELSRIVERSTTTLQHWFTKLERGGVRGLLDRRTSEGRPSPLQNAKVQKALQQGLKEGRWMSEPQLANWLEKKHGIRLKPRCLYYWLGKFAGALKVPRPVHHKKDEAAAVSFKAHLLNELNRLHLPEGRRVRVWVADECRYGLHSFTRRCWGLRGVRVVKRVQQKYQWGYVYGALEVVEGASQFRFMPSVSLDFSGDFLAQIAASDPEAEHVVIQDQAGFHHRPGDARLPAHLHLLPLPPYSPELNPAEKVWDVIKDSIANRVFGTLDSIERSLTAALRPFWEDPRRVLDLVGDGWLHVQANAS